ncbi:MAG TPA: ComEA family DNA-binding protein [Pirellulaceae bacterium]|nr:ComEA family DNA-binding protein [Pirellulaceae bacterium]
MFILAATQYYPAHRAPTIDIDHAAPVPIEFQVDINQADALEFILLPEVGEALAERIVAERTMNGPFRNHGDLRRVRGIGVKTLDRLRPYLLPLTDVEAIAGP